MAYEDMKRRIARCPHRSERHHEEAECDYCLDQFLESCPWCYERDDGTKCASCREPICRSCLLRIGGKSNLVEITVTSHAYLCPECLSNVAWSGNRTLKE